MTDDKLYTSLSVNTIMAQVTNHVQRTRLITSSTDKRYSLDSEDDFRSGCRNVSHQQQFFSELHSPGRSHNTNHLYDTVQIGLHSVILPLSLPRHLSTWGSSSLPIFASLVNNCDGNFKTLEIFLYPIDPFPTPPPPQPRERSFPDLFWAETIGI